MPKFRKMPVVIDAVQFTGENAPDLINWMQGAHVAAIRSHHRDGARTCIEIETLEGTMTADPGDWIIRGVKGELYPCKPDIFAATYEAAQEGP